MPTQEKLQKVSVSFVFWTEVQPVHTPVRTQAYGPALSQSNVSILSVFCLVYNNCSDVITLAFILQFTKYLSQRNNTKRGSRGQLWDAVLSVTLVEGKKLRICDDNGKLSITYAVFPRV